MYIDYKIRNIVLRYSIQQQIRKYSLIRMFFYYKSGRKKRTREKQQEILTYNYDNLRCRIHYLSFVLENTTSY